MPLLLSGRGNAGTKQLRSSQWSHSMSVGGPRGRLASGTAGSTLGCPVVGPNPEQRFKSFLRAPG